MVRLGAGGLDGRKLTETAMDAALQALSKFKRLADSHKVDEILAAATSATREAENGSEFLASITDATFFAEFAGRRLPTRVHLSPDGKTATRF